MTDGFKPEVGHSGSEGRHSADYDETPWVISTEEANRVLAFWRSNAGYSVDPDQQTVDGYLIGSEGEGRIGPTMFGLEMGDGLDVSISAPAAYRPGEPLTMTVMIAYDDALHALAWRPALPTGWKVVSVAGDGNPSLGPDGGILWTGASLPPSPVTLHITVSVPLWEFRRIALGVWATFTCNVVPTPWRRRRRARRWRSRMKTLTASPMSGRETGRPSSSVTRCPPASPAVPGRVYTVARSRSLLGSFTDLAEMALDPAAETPARLTYTDPGAGAVSGPFFYRVRVRLAEE